MSEMKRLSDRNRAIQEMLTSGEGLKTFYRFVANNPHIALQAQASVFHLKNGTRKGAE